MIRYGYIARPIENFRSKPTSQDEPKNEFILQFAKLHECILEFKNGIEESVKRDNPNNVISFLLYRKNNETIKTGGAETEGMPKQPSLAVYSPLTEIKKIFDTKFDNKQLQENSEDFEDFNDYFEKVSWFYSELVAWNEQHSINALKDFWYDVTSYVASAWGGKGAYHKEVQLGKAIQERITILSRYFDPNDKAYNSFSKQGIFKIEADIKFKIREIKQIESELEQQQAHIENLNKVDIKQLESNIAPLLNLPRNKM